MKKSSNLHEFELIHSHVLDVEPYLSVCLALRLGIENNSLFSGVYVPVSGNFGIT